MTDATTPSEDDLPKMTFLDHLEELRWRLIWSLLALTGGVAIAVGTEKFGLTDEALRAADTRVRIPMHGSVNSLNASAAAAIVVYEAVRQRSASAQVTAAPL